MRKDKFVYLVEQLPQEKDNEHTVSILDEVPKDEVDDLYTAQRFSAIYHKIAQVKNIVVENGKDFQDFMQPSNIARLRQNKMKPDILIQNANKLVFNYAMSLKTYVDIHERLLKQHGKTERYNEYKDLCSSFYDNDMEYRFWMNLRNCIAHCELPYNGFVESDIKGYKVICTKRNLLQFDSWKHSKKDILLMDDEIDLPSMVIEMSSMIMALYFHFIMSFGEDIINAISTFQRFCNKHQVTRPGFFVTDEKITRENFERVLYSSKLEPFPMDNIFEAFEELKRNPQVTITYNNSDRDKSI